LLTLGRAQAYKLLTWQLFVCFLTAAAWSFVSLSSGLAALVGGAICLLASGVFVYYALRQGAARQAQQIVAMLFLGEFLKIAIIAVMFGVVFFYTALAPVPVLVGFLATQAMFWVAPFVFKRAIQAKQ
jgi:F0F1-type ATP synthase assembly protein I